MTVSLTYLRGLEVKQPLVEFWKKLTVSAHIHLFLRHYLIPVTSELLFEVIGFKMKGDANIYC
jgi:hypothetical protein